MITLIKHVYKKITFVEIRLFSSNFLIDFYQL